MVVPLVLQMAHHLITLRPGRMMISFKLWKGTSMISCSMQIVMVVFEQQTLNHKPRWTARFYFIHPWARFRSLQHAFQPATIKCLPEYSPNRYNSLYEAVWDLKHSGNRNVRNDPRNAYNALQKEFLIHHIQTEVIVLLLNENHHRNHSRKYEARSAEDSQAKPKNLIVIRVSSQISKSDWLKLIPSLTSLRSTKKTRTRAKRVPSSEAKTESLQVIKNQSKNYIFLYI